MKRLFDVSVSVVALVVLSPVLLVIAILIKLNSPGPAFFVQERVGLGRRPFQMFKFRTMVANAQELGTKISPSDDPRITGVGAFLRRTFLDELPQLFNVLRGDMSLVGPRPETPEYVSLYTPDELMVLTVKPGMTGPSTIVYAREPELLAGVPDADSFYVDHLMHERVRLDLQYLEERSLRYDVGALLRTLRSIVRP